MTYPNPHLRAIAANLLALRPILAAAVRDLDYGLEAAEQGNQNGAVGSIIPAEELLRQASVIIQAIIVIHRQN